LLRTDYLPTVIQRLPLSQLTYLLVDFIPHCQRTIKNSNPLLPNTDSSLPQSFPHPCRLFHQESGDKIPKNYQYLSRP
jgi:hypothetical protein